MENKQTAVEWLAKELESYGDPASCKITWKEFDSLIEQAKRMEMENKYEVRFRDIDPDTGDVSQDKLIAVCETKNLAQWVLQAFERADRGEEPNREFYYNETYGAK